MGSHVLAVLLAVGAASALIPRQAPAADATIQGFSKSGLDALNAAMHKWVDEQGGANVVTLLARMGKS